MVMSNLSVDDELAELTAGELATLGDERGGHRLANHRRAGDDVAPTECGPVVLAAADIVAIEVVQRERAHRDGRTCRGREALVIDLRHRHDQLDAPRDALHGKGREAVA